MFFGWWFFLVLMYISIGLQLVLSKKYWNLCSESWTLIQIITNPGQQCLEILLATGRFLFLADNSKDGFPERCFANEMHIDNTVLYQETSALKSLCIECRNRATAILEWSKLDNSQCVGPIDDTWGGPVLEVYTTKHLFWDIYALYAIKAIIVFDKEIAKCGE